MAITNHSETEYASYGAGFYIDYREDQTWFTVYEPQTVPLYSVQLEPEKTNRVSFVVPNDLFQTAGAYRLYVSDIGYCEIDTTK